jgi:uncharacterized protein YndB with AHSA1/START domain
MAGTTRNSRRIKASAETLFKALTDPKGLETWQVPGEMTGKVHHYDLREGGSYTMSLFYPEGEGGAGKTSGREDRFTATFVTLDPPRKLVERVTFETDSPEFAGEMIMEVTLEPVDDETNVTFLFRDLPPGVSEADNEQGTISSLEKLARYVEVQGD